MPSIVCIGDSITVGSDSLPGGYRTFRGTLQQLLRNAGLVDVDFVGPEQMAPAVGGADPDHAAWGGAGIDASDSTNNISSRLAAIKAAFPSVDLIVLYVGWNAVYGPAGGTIATRYETLLNSVQSGAWAGKKVVCCTLHPEPGKTEASTGGTYAAYAALNTKIRQLCAAAPTTRILADFAALTNVSQAAFVDRLLSRAMARPDSTRIFGGTQIQSPAGGHMVTSFKSIQDFNAQWSLNPPYAGTAAGGGPGALHPTELAVQNGVNVFVRDVCSVVPWFWVWPAEGNAAQNTCVEVCNGFAQGRHAVRGWDFFFQGSRFGRNGDWSLATSHNTAMYGTPRGGWRSDGLTSWYAPDGNTSIEAWPSDVGGSNPSRGIVNFYGAFNRELLANSIAFCWGAQVRLAKIDPAGPADFDKARFLLAMGADYTRSSIPNNYRYDRVGFPLNAMDGGHDAYELFGATDWTLVGGITLGRTSPTWLGPNSTEHFEDPGYPPPLGNWGQNDPKGATPFNELGTYSRTVAEFRADPPRIPDYWITTAGGGSGSGYADVDYWFNPTLGARDIHLLQSGADKLAGVLSRAIINSGALGAGGGGGSSAPVFSPLPGLPKKPNVFLRNSAGTTKNVEPKERDTTAAPAWPNTAPIIATIGVPLSADLVATGSPAPTYAIVSGAPAWLTLNASTGALGGTPSETQEATYNVTVSATVAGFPPVTATFLLRVGRAVSITTTSLPPAVVDQDYYALIGYVGTEPVAIAQTSGSLPVGLVLSGSAVVGRPIALGGPSAFTVEGGNEFGPPDAQALSITVVAAGERAAFITSALPDGVVGTPYRGEIRTSGALPVAVAIPASGLPPGLVLESGSVRNRIRNPYMAGAVVGTPGTQPTNWVSGWVGSGNGLSWRVAGLGVEDGMEYVDIQISGTASATGGTNRQFEAATFIVAAPGETWTSSMYIRKVAGSYAGLTIQGGVYEFDGAGVAQTQTNTTVPNAILDAASLALARHSTVRLLNDPDTTRVSGGLRIAAGTAGATYGITLRIARPQLELAAVASAYSDPRYHYVTGTPTQPGGYVARAEASNGIGDPAASVFAINVAPAGGLGLPSPWSRFVRLLP